jgi:hypothetical protein
MSSVNQSLSLFIPRVFANITQERIADIFHILGLGSVRRVDRVLKQDAEGAEYYSAYIHFEEWYDSATVANFQERVTNPGKEARIVYDDPWYWIVLENKGKKQVPGQRKPTLIIDDSVKKRVSFQPQPEDQFEQPGSENFELPENFAFQENWNLVDSAYAEYYEIQAAQDRAAVKYLECELWHMHQALIAERRTSEFLEKEVKALQEELSRTFKPVPEDIEMGIKQRLFA